MYESTSTSVVGTGMPDIRRHCGSCVNEISSCRCEPPGLVKGLLFLLALNMHIVCFCPSSPAECMMNALTALSHHHQPVLERNN